MSSALKIPMKQLHTKCQVRTLSEIRKKKFQLESGYTFALKSWLVCESAFQLVLTGNARDHSGIGIIFTNSFCHFKNLLLLAQSVLA